MNHFYDVTLEWLCKQHSICPFKGSNLSLCTLQYFPKITYLIIVLYVTFGLIAIIESSFDSVAMYLQLYITKHYLVCLFDLISITIALPDY